MGEHLTPNSQRKDPGIVVTAVNKSENERDKMKLLQVVWSLRRVASKKMTKVLPKEATTPIVPIMNQNQIPGGTLFSPSPTEVLVALTGKVWLFPSICFESFWWSEYVFEEIKVSSADAPKLKNNFSGKTKCLYSKKGQFLNFASLQPWSNVFLYKSEHVAIIILDLTARVPFLPLVAEIFFRINGWRVELLSQA